MEWVHQNGAGGMKSKLSWVVGLVLGAVTAVSLTAVAVNFFDQVNLTGGWQIDETTVNATAAEINAAADQSAWATLDPAADDALTLAEHGAYPSKAILMSNATGDTFTLPAASGSGAVYTIIVSTTVSSNNHIIQAANATDEFYGTVSMIDTDTSDTEIHYSALDGDGLDTITMNGTTTGGIKGSFIQIVDVAAGQWQILSSKMLHSGDVATPLSAAVS